MKLILISAAARSGHERNRRNAAVSCGGNMFRSILFVTGLMLSGVIVGTVGAQPVPVKAAAKAAAIDPLEIKLERRKVVVVDGKEALESASSAKPGEVLEETATYTNKSKGSLAKVEATLPIPPNTELVMSSVKPAMAKASVDGVNFSEIPLKRKIKQANGVEVEQPVPLSEYRYLRWYPGELAAGKSLVFSARFKVSDK